MFSCPLSSKKLNVYSCPYSICLSIIKMSVYIQVSLATGSCFFLCSHSRLNLLLLFWGLVLNRTWGEDESCLEALNTTKGSGIHLHPVQKNKIEKRNTEIQPLKSKKFRSIKDLIGHDKALLYRSCLLRCCLRFQLHSIYLHILISMCILAPPSEKKKKVSWNLDVRWQQVKGPMTVLIVWFKFVF